MNMPIPVPTVTNGPQYAEDEVSCFSIIDSHNHTTGQGVQIPTAGINIDANLSMNGSSIVSCAGVELSNQVGVPVSNTIYSVGGNLYYQNGLSQVQITNGAAVNASPGNITNLISPASVTWVAGTTSYVFKANATQAADVDTRNVILRNAGAGSFGMTVNPPAAMGADTSVTLPNPPAVTSFMTMDNLGQMGVSIPSSLGIDTANIANGAVTNIKIAAGAVNSTSIATNGVATSNITDASVTAVKRAAAPFSSTVTGTVSNAYGPGYVVRFDFETITTSAPNKIVAITIQPRTVNSYFTQTGTSNPNLFVVNPDNVTSLVNLYGFGLSWAGNFEGCYGTYFVQCPLQGTYKLALSAGDPIGAGNTFSWRDIGTTMAEIG